MTPSRNGHHGKRKPVYDDSGSAIKVIRSPAESHCRHAFPYDTCTYRLESFVTPQEVRESSTNPDMKNE